MAKGFTAKTHGYSRRVSQARLIQKSGPRHSFGGYTKVNNGNGSFAMKKPSK